MADKDLAGQYRFLMWGGGLILIVVGLAELLLILFLIGEPIALLYPYVNETVVLILQILGWLNIIPGIIIFILGFWAKKLARYGINKTRDEKKDSSKVVKYVRKFVIIASILLIIAFPIGTFVGITLLRESWMLEYDYASETEEKKG
ncbi:MAG: hypothetical protein HWN66_07450 [Candidatus Helarchaeota archaeon]|nr:hypothetical protein [Candidatus Helarchaeota archaeon]